MMNNNSNVKVDFMIVGAQKCGTTTLAEILRSHPSVVLCDKKEPMFFCSSENWQNELSDYHSLFQWKEGALHFEASTSYTFYPHKKYHNIWQRLYAYNPDLKIVYLVRNPIDRIISGYIHTYQQHYVNCSLERAIIIHPVFLNLTRYATQIKPYIEQFGSEQVKILFFEDLVENRNLIINQLSNFLNIPIDDFGKLDDIHSNKSVGDPKLHHKYQDPGFHLKVVRRLMPSVWKRITDNSERSFKEKPKLSPHYQEMILHLLRHEIDELESITGRDLSSWRKIRGRKEEDVIQKTSGRKMKMDINKA